MSELIPHRVRAFLFDLDCTLVDSSHIILSSLRRSLYEVAGVRVTDKELLKYWGLSLCDIMRKLGVSESCEVITYYREHYPFGQQAGLFEGIQQLLTALTEEEYELAVVTTKNRRDALMHLSENRILEFFKAVIAADDVRNVKPDREPVIAALNMLDCGPDEAVMIGDSPADIEAGQSAGVMTGLACWGVELPCMNAMRADFTWLHPLGIIDSLPF